MYQIDELTGCVIEASIELHRRIGPGLLESAYEKLLAAVLRRRGLEVERQKIISFEFDGVIVDDAFRADLLIQKQLVVEVKAVETITPIFGQTGVDLLEAHESAVWIADQLWWRDAD